MSRRTARRAIGACLAVLVAAVGGCGDADQPVLRMRGGAADDVYFVMHKDDHYHFCKKAELVLDEESVLGDGHGCCLSMSPIRIPGDAEKVMVRSDGMVLGWVEDSWCGLGQLTLIRIRGHDHDDKEPPKPCRHLWEMGTRMVPGRSDCPRIKEVQWVLRTPTEISKPWR